MEQIGTVKTSAHSHDAIKGLPLARSLDALNHVAKHRGPLLVWMPVGEDIAFEAEAVITNASMVKDDLAVARVHDAVTADSVHSFFLIFKSFNFHADQALISVGEI